MGATTFARAEERNVALVTDKLRREYWNALFFARFAGFSTVNKADGSTIPSGAPIEIDRRPSSEGSDHMLVQMLRRLNGAGIYGDNQLKGNEEEMSVYYQKVYINQIRNGVKVGGRVSNQRVKKFKLFTKARPLLSDWLAEWHEYAFFKTFLEGYSPHVFATTADGGFNITSAQKILHPNFYVAGNGLVTWSATAATFESNVDTAVTGLTDTSSDHLTADLLEDIRVQVLAKNMQPLMVDGISFFPFLLHPTQAKQLRKDTDWKNAQQNAAIRSSKNPIFTGAMGEYAGFVFYERNNVFACDPTGSGTVSFGHATGQFGDSNLADVTKKVGVVFGRQALAHGWADGPYFDEEIEDYGNLKGVAVGMIDGTSRAEYKDNSTDGSNTAVVNQSSMLVATYSA